MVVGLESHGNDNCSFPSRLQVEESDCVGRNLVYHQLYIMIERGDGYLCNYRNLDLYL
jgi:hypothetical protein